MPDYIPTPEQLEAMASGLGRIGVVFQLATAKMVRAFAAAARAELRRMGWYDLAIPADHSPGRKRRARRARGRRIEARRRRPQPMTVAQWAVGHRIHPSVYKSGHISSGHIGSVFASLQSRAQAAADAALLHVLTGDSLWKP